MGDGTGAVSPARPRPVDPRIAARWRAFFERGEVFALPVARELSARRLRANTTLLSVLAAVAVAAAVIAVWLFAIDAGRPLTYVLLVVVAVAAIAACIRIASIRRLLAAIRDAPDEYLAVSRSGMRYAGIDFPWAHVVGALVIDERGTRFAGIRKLTARLMLAAGYSRAQVLLGVDQGTVREYRDTAPGAVRGSFFVSMGSGGPRVPLEWGVDPESVDPFTTAVRVSAGDAGVPVIVSSEPSVMHATIMAIWRGRRPGETEGTR